MRRSLSTRLRRPAESMGAVCCLAFSTPFVFWFFLVGTEEVQALHFRPAMLILMTLLAGVMTMQYCVPVGIAGLIIGATATILLRKLNLFNSLLTVALCSVIAMGLSRPAILIVPDIDGHTAKWSLQFFVTMALSGAAMGYLLWKTMKNAFVDEDN